MLFTIVSVTIGIVAVFYLIRALHEPNFNNIAICALAFALFFVLVDKYNTYEDGYNDAIHEAVLTEVTDEGYLIDFNGEVHEYTFD